jgi:hypothetical protein
MEATGGKKEPNPFDVQNLKHGKPVVFPFGGRNAVKLTHETAGKGGWRKRRLACNGLDRD